MLVIGKIAKKLLKNTFFEICEMKTKLVILKANHFIFSNMNFRNFFVKI